LGDKSCKLSPKLAIDRQDVHTGDMNGNQYPAKRDFRAADYVRELRESRGLGRRDLAEAIETLASKGTDVLPYTVSDRTIHRIEEDGAIPGPRVRFAIARFFDVPMADIWRPRRRKVAA
jgi:ribosome-binding protein aMBF1 (putative translation factor)